MSLSYGKDSIACLKAIEELGWALDRIVHVEIWATDVIPADLPPMVKFKKRADAIIKKRWGLEVEHIRGKVSFEEQFYTCYCKGSWAGKYYGWPRTKGSWCCDRLKTRFLDKARCSGKAYVGIAADEPNRFSGLTDTKLSPLKEAGWTESKCRQWAEKNGLLSPIYTDSLRGGCWFCPKQPIAQLRLLRQKYPEYWALMLKWDLDSQRPFKSDGHTIHDFEARFQLEDKGFIYPEDRGFRWDLLNKELNYRLF